MSEKTEVPTFKTIASVFEHKKKMLDYRELLPYNTSMEFIDKMTNKIISDGSGIKYRTSVQSVLTIRPNAKDITSVTSYNIYVNALMDVFEFGFNKTIYDGFISLIAKDGYMRIEIYVHNKLPFESLSEIAGCKLIRKTQVISSSTATISCEVKSQ